jgi:comEA protein
MNTDLIKRRAVLLLERIGIRSSELALILILVLVLGVLSWIKGILPGPVSPFSQETYKEVEAVFKARAEQALKEDSIRLARFHHPEAFLANAAKKDSVKAAKKDSIKAARQAGKKSKTKPQQHFPISLNTADAALLESIPGIGPKIASEIVLYRTQKGPFLSIEELLNIRGIGPKTLEKLKPYVKL